MTKAAMAKMSEESVGGKALSGFERFGSFLKDVRTEMRKVTSPSRKEVQATTLVVIITVFLFAAYFYSVDQIIDFFVSMIFKKAQ